MNPKYDVIVVGGGHAGIEASLAASRMGCKTLLLTMNKSMIGEMSCNPAIGGLAKGQLIKELDALGGEMGKAADATMIQFRTLNTKKGPAVRSSRAQIDRHAYREYMKKIISGQRLLEVSEAMVEDIIVNKGRLEGVKASEGAEYRTDALVLTQGHRCGIP
ncbi:MAG TPA: FAD-dependent oxidoreductase, partial [Candidatus Omnitrophota bacterium]|nr:FAD-dependent oxidoreductase [Candidatus Omnitrophota bacterium]